MDIVKSVLVFIDKVLLIIIIGAIVFGIFRGPISDVIYPTKIGEKYLVKSGFYENCSGIARVKGLSGTGLKLDCTDSRFNEFFHSYELEKIK